MLQDGFSGVNTKHATQEHFNRIIAFRQAIHAHSFGKRRDALSEALDALCITDTLTSFPRLSLSENFRRQWHSRYKALEQGQIHADWLSDYLAQQVPQEGIQYFSLDGTAWPRPSAHMMDDRQYVYHPTPAVNGGSVCIGYPYSLLDWVPEADSRWSLSVSIKRIPGHMTAYEIGTAQIKALSHSRAAFTEVLDIVAADGHYGHAGFLRPLQGLHTGIVVRLRQNRVLYGAPVSPEKPSRGRPRVHGKRFDFKDPATWGEPDECITLEHPTFGQVRLER